MGERGYFRRLLLAIDDCISVVADCYSMKPCYINPFTDFGFKKLFGEETYKVLLIDFFECSSSGESSGEASRPRFTVHQKRSTWGEYARP